MTGERHLKDRQSIFSEAQEKKKGTTCMQSPLLNRKTKKIKGRSRSVRRGKLTDLPGSSSGEENERGGG